MCPGNFARVVRLFLHPACLGFERLHIRTANGLHEVNVDAMTGSVIDDKIETPADEAKEKQQDTKKTKKKSQAPPQ